MFILDCYLIISLSANVDIDECSANAHDCASDALCTNNAGSFTCTCGAVSKETANHVKVNENGIIVIVHFLNI